MTETVAFLFQIQCRLKGRKGKYAITGVAKWMAKLGHTRITVHSDGEEPIKAFVYEVRL